MPQVGGNEVGPTGYGMVGLTFRANPPSQSDAFAVMRANLEVGSNLWNGGEIYGKPDFNTLHLLRAYYKKYPDDADKVVLNIKGCCVPGQLHSDGSRDNVRRSVEDCLRALKGEDGKGEGKIDMFEPARRDSKVPFKETLQALQEYVDAGKIGGIALSEVNANTIREAAEITKIVAVEIELSMWSTEVLTNGIAKTCHELDIPIIAYSPIGYGMLTGTITSFADVPEGDIRKILPRYQPENFETNMKLVRAVQELASKKNCTAAQLALGWVRCLSKRPGMPVIIPIPGSTHAERVRENAKVVDLTEAEMNEIDGILSQFEVKGTRYHEWGMQFVNT